MWIKDDIWSHPGLGERHVFYGPLLTTYSLLSCTTGKLVSNDWVSLSNKELKVVEFFKLPCNLNIKEVIPTDKAHRCELKWCFGKIGNIIVPRNVYIN